jgi:sialic acid synthase SpsE
MFGKIKNIKIGDAVVGEGQPTYIIAEIGSNFDDSLAQAKYLVKLAKASGADAIKFQSFQADKIVNKAAFSRLQVSFQSAWRKPVYDVYKDAEFPPEWHAEVAAFCHEVGVTFLSAPYDREAVDLLDDIDVPAFKVGSGDINFLSLVEYMAQKGKPMIVGTGASTLGEVETVVNAIRRVGNDQIILLHCVTNYPSPVEEANIKAMVTLRDAFQCNVGYSDHTLGYLVPLGAVALGACMIEKHFTLDKTRIGPDHPFAMDAAEFSMMVKSIRQLETALGSPVKQPVPSEKEPLMIQRRCIYAKHDIPKGTTITQDMLTVLRPDLGIKPEGLPLIVGRVAQKNIPQLSAVTWDMI